MKGLPNDIASALLSDLKGLQEKHRHFQVRFKSAEQAARARDEKTCNQNAALTHRIVELEEQLKDAKESMEVRYYFSDISACLSRLRACAEY